MKILRTEFLIKKGELAEAPEIQEFFLELQEAIFSVRNPKGSQDFCINPERQGNGVKPIKISCMKYLKKEGWKLEHKLSLTAREKPGPIDAIKNLTNGKIFAVEWETGNISSSHRALNKMSIGLLEGKIIGGVLILPSRAFYRFLTDRVGNFAEIEPYFPMWRSLPVENGILAVIEIEHDRISKSVRRIKKGTDGRALV
jgi:Restriction endonuclease BamHI.